jgi:serine/threonine protein kinase
MPEAPPTHPDAERLTRFGQGKLSAADSSAVESHLAGCDPCRQVVAALTPDPFMTLLRAAAGPPNRPPLRLQSGYEILGELGRGGMGVVYRARQAALNRTVALKMIRYGPDAGSAAIVRFQREAEAVARLHHPNVVQIYEVGEQDGQPYLALELVDGPSLGEKLADGPLLPRDAAELVAALARAVAHAHSRGVIHRDLKPTNVLLGMQSAECRMQNETSGQMPDGSFCILHSALYIPKITDFGLAKYAEGSQGVTMSGAVIGTPSYMAPEQTVGKPDQVGPAADVYALGAILYECLTGRPPFRAPTTLETMRQVVDNEPVAVRQFQPRVPRDLETVCHKCLRKEVSGRYASAADLAEDLARFLRGEPVRTRPSGPVERAWKWAQRKPAMAALIGLLAVLPLAAGLSLAVHVVQLNTEIRRSEEAAAEASRQQQRADRNYRMARDTLIQMLDQLQGGDFSALPRLTELQAKQAETALAFFEKVGGDAEDPDPAVRLDIAKAYNRAGELATMLSRGPAALDHFQRAVGILEGLVASGGTRESRKELATSLGRLGYLILSKGDAAGAERDQRRALELYEEVMREEGGGPSAGVAWAHHALARTSMAAGKADEAEKHYREAIKLRRELIRLSEGVVPEQRLGAAESLANLVNLYTWSKRPEKAREAYRDAEDLVKPILDMPAYKTRASLALAVAAQNLAESSRNKGENSQAVEECSRGLALAEPVLRRDPELDSARGAVLNLRGTRGQAYLELNRYHEAAADYERVVELCEPAMRDTFRVTRAALLAAADEKSRALAEADDLAAHGKLSRLDRFNVAMTYAIIAKPKGEGPAEEKTALRAIELLRQLWREGFFKKKGNAPLLNEKEFDILRKRDDFQQLLKEPPPK